jgi:hypothetical protein
MPKFDHVAAGDFRARSVRVRLPAEVAFDLDKFQEVQKSILDELGCRACCSGWDIIWDTQRDFIVDRELNVRGGGGLIG